MKVIKLSPGEIGSIKVAFINADEENREVRVAVDFDGFKVKIDNFTWSPPLGEEET